MTLVEYSDSGSSDDDGNVQAPSQKRQKTISQSSADGLLPPLPHTFHSLYTSAARLSTNDDPSLHDGRKRAVPHIEGNWSAHVYLEWYPPPPTLALLTSLLIRIRASKPAEEPPLVSLLTDSLSVPLPLHISLSAPLVLTTQTKDDFQTTIQSSLRSALNSSAPNVRQTGAFTLRPTGLSFHANADGTRSFLVLGVSPAREDKQILPRLLTAINGVAAQFESSELYAGRSDGELAEMFHVSVAWSLGKGVQLPVVFERSGRSGDDDEAKAECTTQTKDDEINELMKRITATAIVFTDVKVKLGRDVTSVPLRENKRGAGIRRGYIH